MKKYYGEPKTVESGVLQILRDYPQARYDDMILVMHYYDRYGYIPANLLTVADIAQNYRQYRLPCFESIRRARQRVQACCPELSRVPQPEHSGICITITIEEENHGIPQTD